MAAGLEESDVWLCEGCQGARRRGAAGTNPSALWEFPPERLLRFLTGRLMEGGRGKGQSAG